MMAYYLAELRDFVKAGLMAWLKVVMLAVCSDLATVDQ